MSDPKKPDSPTHNYCLDEVRLIHGPGLHGLRIALSYPNSYETGMSNLGIHTIYRQLCLQPEVSVERFFHVPGKRPQSVESGRAISDFDVLAFSVTYEMDFFNLGEMLLRGGIPARSQERGDRDPLVIMGGQCASQNPLPLADLVDAFLLGDGEEGGILIWNAILESGWPGCSRTQVLDSLAALPGCYVPAVHGTVDDFAIPRLTVADLSQYDTCSCILTPHTQFGDMFLAETTRGCNGGCKFCLVGFTQPKERQHSSDRILGIIRDNTEKIRRVGFMGSSVCGHPELIRIIDETVALGKTVSISSMRADQLTPELLEALARGGMKTMTLAPESGDEIARLQLNKKITDRQFLDLARAAGETGVEIIKLYALVGTPEAPENEIDSIAALAAEVRREFLRARRSGPRSVTVGAAPFVPKPHTPFGGMPMADESRVARDLKRLRTLLAKEKIRFTTQSSFESVVQGAFSLSGAEAGEVILEVAASPEDWRRIIRRELGHRLCDPRVVSEDRHVMPLRRNHPIRGIIRSAPRQRAQV